MSDTPASASPLSDLFTAGSATVAARAFAWSPHARSLDGFHGWLKAALFGHMAVQAVTMLTLAVMLLFFAELANGGDVDPAMGVLMLTAGTIGQFLPFAVVGMLIACIICYLLFVHRAMKNLHLSKARGLTVSPGWAVGFSFIPFVNLWMIYRVMKEVWEASADPERGRREAPQLLGWWYGMYIGGNVLGRVSDMLVPPDPESMEPTSFLGAFTATSVVGMASGALAIAASLCLLKIVHQIRDAQETLRATSAFEE
jgi:hypothetical protein